MGLAISNLPTIGEVLKKYNLQPNKRLGQNFIFDLNLTRKIAGSVDNLANLNVVEVGAGPGALTRSLLELGANHVYAVEIDQRAIQAQQEIEGVSDGKLSIIQQDALQLDLRSIANKPCAVVANLPYNIATKLIMNWLDYATHFTSITVMVQKEVAQRIVAEPRSKAYGRLSVMCQWLADCRILFDVAPENFIPAPKVTSSIVQITPRAEPLYSADKSELEKLVKQLFGQRRKMIKKTLKGMQVLETYATKRPEELGIEDFIKLLEGLKS